MQSDLSILAAVKVSETVFASNKPMIVLLFMAAVCWSCGHNDVNPTPLELLNSSSWIGSTEVLTIESDLEGNVISESTYLVPDHDYKHIVLNADKTAIVTYQCTTSSCNGDKYEGKWDLTEDHLLLTLNREQFNSLADHSFIDAKLFRVNKNEMILETTTYDIASATTKIIRRAKYIRQ